MDNNNESFSFSYSAKEQEEVERIRSKYIPREESKLERLRRLDESAVRLGTVLSLIVGIVSTLIMGLGMSMAMVWTDTLLPVGIAVGVFGMLGISCAHPVYTLVVKKERERLAPEILALTEELLK
jgi:hypothetical protein